MSERLGGGPRGIEVSDQDAEAVYEIPNDDVRETYRNVSWDMSAVMGGAAENAGAEEDAGAGDVSAVAELSNKEKKNQWEAEQDKLRRVAEQKILNGEMPTEPKEGESFDEWLENEGAEVDKWTAQEEARTRYQEKEAELEAWENGGGAGELRTIYPRMQGESKEGWAARVRANMKMELSGLFRRQEGEGTEEWSERLLKEGEQKSKILTPDEMRESEDADIFRDLTGKNPQWEDEPDGSYWARLCWLNEQQKELQERKANGEDVGEKSEDEGDEEVGEESVGGGEADDGDGGDEGETEIPEWERPVVNSEEEAGNEAEKKNLTGVAVEQNVDQMIKDEMEKIMETDLNKMGFIRKVLWGNMFREAYKECSYREAATKAVQERLGAKGLSDVTEQRFVAATVEGAEGVIHGEVGERAHLYRVGKNEDGQEVVYKVGRDAEGNETQELVDVEQVPEAKATLAVKQAIEEFAAGKMKEGDLEEAVKRIQMEMVKNGGDAKTLMAGNYVDVAKTAKEMYEHAESMDEVTDGFQMIYGKAVNEVRTEVHRNAVDKIGDWLRGETGAARGLRRVIPVELVVGAAELALVAIPGVTKRLGNAAIPILGGSVVNGLINAAKEGSRVTEDREAQARQLATGEVAGNTKYDREMQVAQYEMKSARDLTESLQEAVKSGDNEQLLALLADTESRVRMSDQDKIDLISFSNGENVEAERFGLDMMIAQAKVALGEDALKAESYTQAVQEASEKLREDRSAKDVVFKKLRHKRMAAQGVKAAVSTAVVGTVFQEALAFFRPDQYGFAEAVVGVTRPEGASDTMLAGAMRPLNIVGGLKSAEALADLTGVSAEQAEELAGEGYAMVGRTVTNTVTETQTINKPVSVRDFLSSRGAGSVHRVGWGMNGTSWSDGNELGLWNNSSGNGFVTNMSGLSTTGGGQTIDFSEAASEGKVSMLLSLSDDTQGTPIEIVGKALDNGQIEFSSDDSTIQELIQNKAYKYAEVVYNAGTAADGGLNVIPLATDVGNGVGADTIMDTVTSTLDTMVTETVYDAVNPGVAGAAGLPILGRKNLTLGERPPAAEGEPSDGEAGGESEPAGGEGDEGGGEDLSGFRGASREAMQDVRAVEGLEENLRAAYPQTDWSEENMEIYRRGLALGLAAWRSLSAENQEVVKNYVAGGESLAEEQPEYLGLPEAMYASLRQMYGELVRLHLI